jgi:hypothetical protein
VQLAAYFDQLGQALLLLELAEQGVGFGGEVSFDAGEAVVVDVEALAEGAKLDDVEVARDLLVEVDSLGRGFGDGEFLILPHNFVVV